MRERSPAGPITVRAVAGTYTVLLGIDLAPELLDGLLGFAIERVDHTGGEREFLDNSLLFAVNDTGKSPSHSSLRNPVQAFQWGDYTAKPAHTYSYSVTAMYGTPAKPTPGVSTSVQIGTEDPDDGRHGVFFNRGVVASRAYEERFGTQAPSKVPNDEAYKWLSRGLEEAIVGFIGQAVDKRYQLRAAMYEFNFEPVLTALKVASDAGADVQVVVHEVPKKGDNTPQRNLAAIAKTGITRDSAGRARRRRSRTTSSSCCCATASPSRCGPARRTSPRAASSATPTSATASATARSRSAISTTGSSSRRTRRPRRSRRSTTPRRLPEAAARTRARRPSSARARKLDALEWYCRLADSAKGAVFLTAAFGLTAQIAPVFEGERPYLRYLLMDLETGNVETVRRDPSNLVAAGGFNAKGGWRTWIAKGLTNLNGHVDYVHTKFMLVDPLGDGAHRRDRLGQLERRVDPGQRREHGRDPR